MKINLVFKNITLEPVLFFMSIVGSMDSVSVGQLLIDKSCQNHFHYSDEICDNLLNDTNEHYNAEVENDVAQYKVKFTWIISPVLPDVPIRLLFKSPPPSLKKAQKLTPN